MFIIKCDRDKSYCKVADTNVIYTSSDPPNEGDDVCFLYNNSKELGRVIIVSNDMNVIDKKFEKIKETLRVKKRKYSDDEGDDKGDDVTDDVPSKRLRKVNKKYSSESYENLNFLKLSKPIDDTKKDSKESTKRGKDDKKQQVSHKNSKLLTPKDSLKLKRKMGDDNIQSMIEKDISQSKKYSIYESPSPSKDDLKKRLEKAEKELAFAKQSNASPKSQPPIKKRSLKKAGISTEVNNSRTESEGTSDESVHDTTDSDTDGESTPINNEYSKTAHEIIDMKNKNSLPEKIGDHKNVSTIGNKIETGMSQVEKDNIENNLANDNDLYGKNWPEEKMVKLMNQIYCKESVLNLATSLSSQASHVARRLITGVIKPSGYLDATFSGQASRVNKPDEDQQPLKVKPLNETAKNEIIDYALARANKKGWKNKRGVAQTQHEVERAMSQRIGELKRGHKENTKVSKKPTEP